MKKFIKKTALLTIIALSSATGVVQASYTAMYPEITNIRFVKYTGYEDLKSNWVNSGTPKNCLWTPLENTVTLGTTFTQTANDCKQTQTRTSQARERDEISNNIRNVGTPTTESQEIVVSSTRSSVGTKPKDQTCLFGDGKAYWLESSGVTRIIWYSSGFDVSFPTGPTSYKDSSYEYTRGNYYSLEGGSGVYTAYYYACRSSI